MMMESIGREKTQGWPHAAWLVVVAVGLLVIATVLAWYAARRAADDARALTIVSELQLMTRDVSALSSLAAGGNQAALTQLRDRVANLESKLATLIPGQDADAAVGAHRVRLQEFASRWAEFKHRTDALFALPASPETQASKDRRPPEKRAPTMAAQKPAPRASREAELSATAFSLLNAGHGLAGTLDGIRTELDRQARTPWLHYLALACVLGAVTALTAFVASTWRREQAMQRTSERTRAELFEALRPAMRTLHIRTDAASLAAEPAALGRRLSDEILTVVDGVKALVKALDTTTAEADKFAVVGHVAARALATAEQNAAHTSSELQATARRLAAVYTTLSANSTETQQRCVQLIELVDAGVAAISDFARSGSQLRARAEALSKRFAQSVAVNRELSRSLFEVTDLLTQTEGFALRAADRLGGAAPSEAIAFAGDVRNSLGPSVAILKKAIDLTQRIERETDELANELSQLSALAADQSRTVANASYVLANAESAGKALSAKLSSAQRLASGAEGSQLVSALDEIVRQIAQSSASARQVLHATQNAATHIGELAKLLNTMKSPPAENGNAAEGHTQHGGSEAKERR